VEHMKNVARGLENKIIELQQKLTEKVTFNLVIAAKRLCCLSTPPCGALSESGVQSVNSCAGNIARSIQHMNLCSVYILQIL